MTIFLTERLLVARNESTLSEITDAPLTPWLVFRVFPSMCVGNMKMDFFCFLGYYMYLETSSPRKKLDTADLYSPPYKFNGTVCVTFWYHMFGASIGRLHVYLTQEDKSSPEEKWKRKGKTS